MSAWLSKHQNDVHSKEVTDKYKEYYNKNVVIKQFNNNKIEDVIISEDADNIYLQSFGILGKFEIKHIRLA